MRRERRERTARADREREGDVSAGVGTDRGTTGARASVGSAGHARECRCAGGRPEVRHGQLNEATERDSVRSGPTRTTPKTKREHARERR